MTEKRGTPSAHRRPPPWLPNAITVVRLALVPVFLVAASRCAGAVREGASGELERIVAGAALIAIGLSDVLDGHLARRYRLVTPLGAVLDAAADKVVQLCALILFWRTGEPFARIPAWFVALVVARDLVLATGALLVRRRQGRVQVVHQPHGKISSLLLFVLLVGITFGWDGATLRLAMWGIAAIVSVSTLDYVLEGWRQFRRPPRGAAAR